MPLSYPPIRRVQIDGQTRYQATCRTCGQDVCARPQVVKVAVDELRRAHGFEADCRRAEPKVMPCTEHRSILHPSFPWHRVLEVAEDCPDCEVTS